MIFPVARPEATAGGILVTDGDGKTYPAQDRDYVLDVMNHVLRLDAIDARFIPGDVFAGEPSVVLKRNSKQ